MNHKLKRLARFQALLLVTLEVETRLRLEMTLLLMFGGFMAAVAALTYVEVRRIRKKLTPK
jgi:hypothetical protein